MVDGSTVVDAGVGDDTVRPGVADVLCLAAAPTFAAMALLTAIFDARAPDMVCGQGASLFGGMVPMYALMGVFHAAPWLRRVFGR
jgi:hypothetical protein